MGSQNNTFWVFEDHRGVHNIVDALEKVPPSLQHVATKVVVTAEEAAALRGGESQIEPTQETRAEELDNGSEYAEMLPPGVNPDTMASAGIFLLALVFLRRLALHHGYKTFGRVAAIAIFTMAIGVVWTFAGVVAKQNAAKKQAPSAMEQVDEGMNQRLNAHEEMLNRLKNRD